MIYLKTVKNIFRNVFKIIFIYRRIRVLMKWLSDHSDINRAIDLILSK